MLPEFDRGQLLEQRLTGHAARRRPGDREQVLWDKELPGFGLRVRSSGHKTWIVQHRRRGKLVKVTLGTWPALSANKARSAARVMLSEAATEGLSQRKPRTIVAPTFADYVETFWRDYARHWKPSTQKRNRHAITNDLTPVFGDTAVDSIRRADILRWRDGMGERQGVFNRALPVLAVMLGYAEQLGLRPPGSNPCKGTPRYKRRLPERYLSRAEYRRLGAVLADAADEWPASVAIIRLLMLTGARVSEILTLRWEYIQPPRLKLPDSKTGPKTVFLNRPAMSVLASIDATVGSLFVFPGRTLDKPVAGLSARWTELRRRAALSDVRLHDLRHSFASVAINENVSLTLIGGLLGHALPETTMRYAHLADQSVVDAAHRVCATVAAHLHGAA